MLTDSPKISTPKKIHLSKSPYRCILKKSKRRECTPDSPDLKSQTEFKPNRIRQLLEREANQTVSKNKFLSLIEESLNEVSDNYYKFLGSQVTPDSLFSSVFTDKCLKKPEFFSVKNLKEEILKKNLNEVNFFYLGG